MERSAQQRTMFILPPGQSAAPERAATSNLPAYLTPLIGRELEVQAVCALLQRPEVRLVTLTGPGGVGKTRLGVHIATEVLDDFADGVSFVSLAPISDSDLVIPTIAKSLDLAVGDAPLEHLKTSLQEKHLLLLLDNFEQVVAAAPLVVELLGSCPNVKALVTSRMVLRVQGEYDFAVPPLSLPDLTQLPGIEALPHYAAVALFLQRAQAIRLDFQLTSTNARTIAEICTRLDGLPLAIELAAARLNLLSPQALLARLEHRLAILTSQRRDVPARQQTLRDTLEWSYSLLTPEEQRLFRRLSVFVGGCTLEAIEAVCAALDNGAGQVLDGVASLLDKSLLQQTEQEAGEPRLTMLETVREYGLECLSENREAGMSQRAHAMHYLALAEEAEPHLKGAQQVLWWRRLEREQGNLRAALEWLIEQQEGEFALCLGGALWWFWNIRGYWSEGWHWLEAALALPQVQERTAGRAKVLVGAAEFANRLGNPRVHTLIEESMSIYRELGDKRGLAESLSDFGMSKSLQNEVAAARTLLDESLALAREAGDRWLVAKALYNIGRFRCYHGDDTSAYRFFEESVKLSRELNNRQMLSETLLKMVDIVMSKGDLALAAVFTNESLVLTREIDNWPDIVRALRWLAVIQAFQGDTKQAIALLEESQALAQKLGDTWQLGIIQLTLGRIVLHQRDFLRAETCAQESLTLFKELGTKSNTVEALSLLGDIRRMQEVLTQAEGIYKKGVALAGEAGCHCGMGRNLIGLARIAAIEGHPVQAVRLFGAAEPWLNPKAEMDPFERADYERAVEHVRALLGEKAFAAAWKEGRSMTPEQAINAQSQTTMSLAQLPGSSSTPPVKPPPLSPDGLTAREVEVLRLVAQGLTIAQIAEHLMISFHTANAHVRSIYTKLEVTSRSAATRYALEHHLS